MIQKTANLKFFILFTFLLAMGVIGLYFKPFFKLKKVFLSNQEAKPSQKRDNKMTVKELSFNKDKPVENHPIKTIALEKQTYKFQQNKGAAFNKKTLKTACREVQKDDSFKTPLHRAEKLNLLMDQAIDWVLIDLKDEPIDLYCLRDKKIIVLNFWATWCAPCIRELPSLSKLAETYKKEIFVLALSTEDQNTVKSFLKHSFKGLSPQLKIATVKEEEKLKRFPKDKIPTTYIFNKKGFLKIKQLGEKNWSDKNIIQQILN